MKKTITQQDAVSLLGALCDNGKRRIVAVDLHAGAALTVPATHPCAFRPPVGQWQPLGKIKTEPKDPA